MGIDPSHPYVLVVADPNGLVQETDETDNTASFRKYTIGVVTHGFEPDAQLPTWVGNIAADLLSRRYDSVIPFDWSDMSNLPRSNQCILASYNLVHRVLFQAATLAVSANDTIDLHLIGHSRGAVVISYALESLIAGAQTPDQMNRGYFKMTMLDPHPASNRHPLLFSFSPTALGWLFAFGSSLFQAAADDPDPFLPLATHESELFFQQSEWFQAPGFERIGNLWGLADLPVGFLVNWTGFGTGHLEVPLRYETDFTSPAANQVSQAVSDGDLTPTDVDLLYPAFVDNSGVAQSLATKIAAAKAAFDHGNVETGRGILNAFVNEIRAQRGKHMTLQAADFFTTMAKTILNLTP
jgi:hypothetical protein